MKNAQTPSDLMVERQHNNVNCVLPHQNVQKFLVELIEQSTFQGHMVEFVAGVKELIKTATIRE